MIYYFDDIMKPSRVLQKLRAGQSANCFKINLESSRAVEVGALSGFDCLWLDTEHVANDWGALEKQILATKAHGADCLVRVARGSYSDLIRPLELDATGIMVPHIMNLEDAQNIVRQTRFHPLGRRALDGGNADGSYARTPLDEYLREANEQRFVILQIEDPEPLDDLEAVAALEGVDMLFFGPGDFSQSIGAPGDWDHPLITETRRRVAQVCQDNGKFAGTVGGVANLDELLGLGYQFISLGADVVGLSNYCSSIIAEWEKRDSAPQNASIYG